jgi:dihydrofolate reductase
MRKLVSYLLCSLDGVVQDNQLFALDYFDDEMYGHLKALIDRQDAVLLGRRTYELWVDHWPTSTHEPFASFINSTPKYVASTTLQEVGWSNASLLGGDVAEEVSRLKAEPGGDIGVHGSPELVRYLLQQDLVDELRLAVFPVAVGKGGRLLDGLDQMRHLELVDVDRTGQGVLVLTYQPSPPRRSPSR